MQDARNVNLAVTKGREIRDALAAALVLQVEVTKVGEGQYEVFLGDGLRVVDDVAWVVVDTDPRVVDLGEDLTANCGGGQQVSMKRD